MGVKENKLKYCGSDCCQLNPHILGGEGKGLHRTYRTVNLCYVVSRLVCSGVRNMLRFVGLNKYTLMSEKEKIC